MRFDTTYVWGVAADEAGIIRHTKYGGQTLPRGGLRAWKRVQLEHEPASAYSSSHPAPMPMRWQHDEEIGQIAALRRANRRLLAVAVCTLEPDELAWLTENKGELRWWTSTNNRVDEPLRIDGISLTTTPATIGLPSVRWWKLNAVKGNLPSWVQEDLARADKTEFRSRHELEVHDLRLRALPPRCRTDQQRVFRGPAYERQWGARPDRASARQDYQCGRATGQADLNGGQARSREHNRNLQAPTTVYVGTGDGAGRPTT